MFLFPPLLLHCIYRIFYLHPPFCIFQFNPSLNVIKSNTTSLYLSHSKTKQRRMMRSHTNTAFLRGGGSSSCSRQTGIVFAGQRGCLPPPLTQVQEDMKEWGSVWPSFQPAHFLVLWTDFFSVWTQRIRRWKLDLREEGLFKPWLNRLTVPHILVYKQQSLIITVFFSSVFSLSFVMFWDFHHGSEESILSYYSHIEC